METHYFRYPLEAFKVNDKPFEVSIGENIFSEKEVQIKLRSDEKFIEGHLFYGEFSKISSTVLNPSIMGYFAYIPKMECNHGVISMDHRVNGNLQYGDEQLEFIDDGGYLEKDWGTSFPQKYIWIQANHFGKQGISLMCSVAKIPMFGFHFNGLIANLQYNGEEYRFATYNGSKVTQLSSHSGGVSLEITKRHLTLAIDAKIESTGSLKAPMKGSMSNTIKEGLGGTVSLTLKDNGKTIAQLTSQYAGIEVVGYDV